MRPFCVIHVSVGLHLGGMEKLLIEFAKHADRSRFALHFLSLTTRGDAAEQIERAGCPVTALDITSGIKMSLPLRLRSIFKSLGADVVHTHNTKPLLYAAPAARFAGASAIIHTRHGQRLGASRRQTALFNLACRCTDRVVSVSADSTELAGAQGLPRERLTTIHNGIDLSRLPFSRREAAGPIVFVGRLSPEKDVETLLRAMRIVRKTDAGVRLNIAGEGPDRTRLESICRRLNLQEAVTFLGAVADIPALLARSSLFVLPSLSEGISLSLLEAMASGVPAIATRVGGNAEVIDHDRTGLLVSPGVPSELARAIQRLRADEARADQFADAARRTVDDRFDVRLMIDRYQSLYQSILDRSHSLREAA